MDILKHEIRQPIVSGLFYPDSSEELRLKVEELLKPCSRGKASLILCPHGTWENTGLAIASAFAAAADFKPDRILLLGPVHREKDQQVISMTSKKYFETPLGLVTIDRKSCHDLESGSDIFKTDDSPHMEEHALELILPFIQHLYPGIEIIPLLAGSLKARTIKRAASLLKKVMNRDNSSILVVLSVNLSRFGPADETENESQTLLKNLRMPLGHSLTDLEAEGKISSCGNRILTLVSETNWADGLSPAVLEKGSTLVNDKNVEKAVYYAGICWT